LQGTFSTPCCRNRLVLDLVSTGDYHLSFYTSRPYQGALSLRPQRQRARCPRLRAGWCSSPFSSVAPSSSSTPFPHPALLMFPSRVHHHPPFLNPALLPLPFSKLLKSLGRWVRATGRTPTWAVVRGSLPIHGVRRTSALLVVGSHETHPFCRRRISRRRLRIGWIMCGRAVARSLILMEVHQVSILFSEQAE
jgi:hypothetical protein